MFDGVFILRIASSFSFAGWIPFSVRTCPEKSICLCLRAALHQDGRPLAYASRVLTAAERNYAQIEKELLAIVFATENFHQSTCGKLVIVESDHKPLEAILVKPLVSAPKRLQKMILRPQRYDLDMRYKKGKELYIADTLSRHYPKLTEATQDHEEHVLLARSTFED